MTSNVKPNSSEHADSTVMVSQSRYIDERESRFEAEVSPYSFERIRPATTSIDEKDQRMRRPLTSV
jgi:hypothetical protein